MKFVESLEFSLFKTRCPRDEFSEKCDSAYDLWLKEWRKAFEELKVEKPLTSDDFVDRELGGLFLEGKAVGFLLYNSFDLSKKYHTDHSYFNNYNADVFSFLRTKGFKKTMVISYMTIHPEWRKRFTNYPISELLISFCTKRFQASNYDSLVGYFRKDRKTNEMFYRHGARSIIKDLVKYNVPVDFAYITKETLRPSSIHGVSEIANFLWNDFFEKRSEDERGDGYIHEAAGREDFRTKMVG